MRRGPPRRPWAAILLLVPLTLAPLPAMALDVVEQLAGRWASKAGQPFTMDWSVEGDGFALRWTVPGRGEAEAAFITSGRPGVFVAGGRERWSMFGDKPVNPLVDGPLHWARAAADTVYVYSLVVDQNGAFVLDRYACHPEGEKLKVTLLRRLPDGQGEEMSMLLERVRP